MAQPQIALSALANFRSKFAGTILQPGDPEYDNVRALFNGMVDKHPAVIAKALQRGRYCRRHRLCAGAPPGDRRSGRRSQRWRTCQRRRRDDDRSLPHEGGVGGSCGEAGRCAGRRHLGRVQQRDAKHGLATTGGVISTTGIAGLTLGGGFGYLAGKHGLAVDNLVAATVVTADGRVVRASEDENPDLFWALRGGSGNFGVVSSFEYRLHPVGPTIMAGAIAWPFSRAQEVLRFFREFAESTPDEIISMSAVGHAPDGSGVKVVIIGASLLRHPRRWRKSSAPH